MSLLSAVLFSSPVLGTVATANAVLYQRNACNLINATADAALNVGTLTTDQTQLSVGGQVMRQNSTNYYKFTLDGDSLKMDFSNITATADLRVQLMDSSGTVIADNQGTDKQKDAYTDLTTFNELKTDAGDYVLKVSYGITSLKTDPQTYTINLYSGTQFYSTYQTTAASQTSLSQKVAVDNTLTFATSDAQYYTTQAYNRVNASFDSSINIGWLYENKGALSVSSKVTNVDSDEYYSFTLQKGSVLKMSFNNLTDTTGLRVQVTDATGYSVFADSNGTDAQKAAYEKITSSEGMKARPGQYCIKVTYDKGADRTKPQNYTFNVYSGDHYSNLYKTTASAESYDTAYLNGTLKTGNYNAATAAASYLYGLAQGEEIDIFSILSSLLI